MQLRALKTIKPFEQVTAVQGKQIRDEEDLCLKAPIMKLVISKNWKLYNVQGENDYQMIPYCHEGYYNIFCRQT